MTRSFDTLALRAAPALFVFLWSTGFIGAKYGLPYVEPLTFPALRIGITLGTLYQKRHCGNIDWRAGNFIQYIAAAILFTLGAWLFETRVIHWTADFVFALAWMVIVMSLGAVGLMYWLIRRSAATSMASLFYLVPAVTSLLAFVMFGERLDALSIAGMVVCAIAVFLVNWRRLG